MLTLLLDAVDPLTVLPPSSRPTPWIVGLRGLGALARVAWALWWWA